MAAFLFLIAAITGLSDPSWRTREYFTLAVENHPCTVDQWKQLRTIRLKSPEASSRLTRILYSSRFLGVVLTGCLRAADPIEPWPDRDHNPRLVHPSKATPDDFWVGVDLSTYPLVRTDSYNSFHYIKWREHFRFSVMQYILATGDTDGATQVIRETIQLQNTRYVSGGADITPSAVYYPAFRQTWWDRVFLFKRGLCP